MADDKVEVSKEELEWKLLKGAYLSKKQGETLERISKPTTIEEIESLGDMGSISTGCLSLYQRAQQQLKSLTGYQGTALVDHAQTLYRGSAQRNFKRGELLLQSIGQIGAHIPEQPKIEHSRPIETDWND